AGGEGQCPADRGVVRTDLGGAADRAVGDRDRLVAGGGQRHGKVQVRGAGVRLGDARRADRHARRAVVVEERAGGAGGLEGGVDRVGQHQGEGLVRLIVGVRQDGDVHRLERLAGGEGERAAGGDVVDAGLRRTVQGGKGDGLRAGRGRVDGDREGDDVG